MANANPTSPIRFTTMAFIADLLACILVYQKLIKRYEHNPTPSHPINNCNKLSDVTNTIMKNVNKLKYDINRGKCGSSPIYSVEYMCTNADTVVTNISITAVTLSKHSPKFRLNNPDSIHVHKSMYVALPHIPTS